MKQIPFTRNFCLEPMDNQEKELYWKARCCIRWDLEDPRFDFNADDLCAPVASHDSIRILLAISASMNFILEEEDVANAYLYAEVDVPIIMEQPRYSSGNEAYPGHVCDLAKSIPGL